MENKIDALDEDIEKNLCENKTKLLKEYSNGLKKVADDCEQKYGSTKSFEEKTKILNETRVETLNSLTHLTQSISELSKNFINVLEKQLSIVDSLCNETDKISFEIVFYKEQVNRSEIGKTSIVKDNKRLPKIQRSMFEDKETCKLNENYEDKFNFNLDSDWYQKSYKVDTETLQYKSEIMKTYIKNIHSNEDAV